VRRKGKISPVVTVISKTTYLCQLVSGRDRGNEVDTNSKHGLKLVSELLPLTALYCADGLGSKILGVKYQTRTTQLRSTADQGMRYLAILAQAISPTIFYPVSLLNDLGQVNAAGSWRRRTVESPQSCGPKAPSREGVLGEADVKDSKGGKEMHGSSEWPSVPIGLIIAHHAHWSRASLGPFTTSRPPKPSL